MSRYDLLVIGAGPAGMAAAMTVQRHGLRVMVLDDQPAPGGQIWRSIETSGQRDDILGPAYTEGRSIAREFRASGASYLSGAQVWRIDPGFRIYVSVDHQAQVLEANAVVFATGAQERPIPFPGWTLPGVLTIGAAQILLKSAGEIPTEPVWIAGSGPLALLYALQLLRAGGTIAGFLDTTPAGQWRKALRHLPRALRASSDLLKGLSWQAALRRSRIPVVKGVTEIAALGENRIERLRYATAGGSAKTVDANVLLVHEGVVPSIHAAISASCELKWSEAQDCFIPVVDSWGESTQPNLFIAGDGAGIAGAKAASLRGTLAGIRIAERAGTLPALDGESEARGIRDKLDRELAIRPFLDALYKPRRQIFEPADNTIVCRCEAVSAADIRSLATIGSPGPNQLKAGSRAGMGPCQGRQCGYTVTRILAAEQGRTPADVGFLHIRPPIKPVTLGELAAIDPSAKL